MGGYGTGARGPRVWQSGAASAADMEEVFCGAGAGGVEGIEKCAGVGTVRIGRVGYDRVQVDST